MTRFPSKLPLLLLLSAALACGGVYAAEGATPAKAQKTSAKDRAGASLKVVDEIGESIRQIALARQLIAHGIANKNALSLVVAMQIIREAKLPTNARIAGAGKDPAKTPPGRISELRGAEVTAQTIQVLAKKAREFAGNRRDLLALIDEVEKSQTRGAGGLVYGGEVSGGRAIQFQIEYEGGKPAVVYVDGDGTTDLDVFVYDAGGRVVCADTRAIDVGLCEWVVPRRAKYTVRIVNHGGTANNFALLTN